MNWSTVCCSWMNFERATWRQLGSNWYLTCCSSCRVIPPCTWLEQALSFYALFPFLYLCRAAHGSADIPILPHAHTILLKHAVNLKRRRTLFNKRLALSSPFCKCTNRAVTQLLDSPKKLRWALALLLALPGVMWLYELRKNSTLNAAHNSNLPLKRLHVLISMNLVLFSFKRYGSAINNSEQSAPA